MINNDVLRSVRYALDLADARMAEIIRLAGREVEKAELENLLKKEDEDGFVLCDDALMLSFLDGLIIHKRGRMEARPEPDRKPEKHLSNNTILKKLRVAFELKEDDMHQILALAGFDVSKPELSALFRLKGHKNYRACGDQLLRNFLKGLTLRLRG
ncbi:hypothetical protein GALL_443950 [mine drainage metagenome]|uniref:Protein containing DUF1456 n=1 Tax=mine drainage metagenome TaxID=410659 RepID=A0A1J5PS53_9ZZZZ